MFQIMDDIYWIGFIDWDLGMFHSYSTPHGSTYNAYLIMDEKPTLIDTVKHYGAEDMLRQIKEVIDPSEIKYVISNHAEMDHSGAIDQLLRYCPQAEVVCSTKGVEILKKHFKRDWAFKPVKTGDSLNIGKRKLFFYLMPMVHWPESMATYSQFDKILFPNDAFGQHYASVQRYTDEVDDETVYFEAAKYYANIVMPYGPQVLKAVDLLSPLEIEKICPSHGLMWRMPEGIGRIIKLYKKWAGQETENKVVIAYDTMWHSTAKMANRLYEAIRGENIPVKLMNLAKDSISDVATEILSARFLLAGSPILNNRILPSMASLLTYLKGLQPKKRFAATFGSYGWSKAPFKEFEESLTEAGFTLIDEGRYVQFVPGEEELSQLNSLVSALKDKLTVAA